MKTKIFAGLLTLALVLFGAFLFTKNVSATTGGPTTIDRVSFKASENSLYYILNDGGGRGCEPEITKWDLSTNTKSVVVPCEKIGSTFKANGFYSRAVYDEFISTTFGALTALPSINFANNDIEVSVSFVGEHKFDEFNSSTDFKATISQDGVKKGEVDFIGCYKDQTHVFRGYRIPNTDKLALVVSRIGTCFEGGYVTDTAHVVSGLTFKEDAVFSSNSYTGPEVHLGDVAVTVQSSDTTPAPTPSDSPSDTTGTVKTGVSLIGVIVSLIVGIAIGYVIKKKSAVQAPPPPQV